jgi:FlaA1/EpsC-like NDP-sugar epimerase
MIRLAGCSESEIRIEFSGLRAGEKLYEELLADADTTLPTSVSALRVARLTGQPMPAALLHLLQSENPPVQADARQLLSDIVAEYQGDGARASARQVQNH